MNSNYDGAIEQLHSQVHQDYLDSHQLNQGHEYVSPSTSTGYYEQVDPIPGSGYNHIDANATGNCNVPVDHFAKLRISNVNTLPNNNAIRGAEIIPGVDYLNYKEIILPNGETVLMNRLYKLSVEVKGQPIGQNKSKRIRTVFTEAQSRRLEEEYALNRYLEQVRRKQISDSLNLTERTVKVWFQNRRMKDKKALEGGVSSSETKNAFEIPPVPYNVPRNVSYQNQTCPRNNLVNSLQLPQNLVTNPYCCQLPTYSEAVGYYLPTNSSIHQHMNVNPSEYSHCHGVSVPQASVGNNLDLSLSGVKASSEAFVESSPSVISDERVRPMTVQVYDVEDINDLSSVSENSLAEYTDLDSCNKISL